MGSLGSSGRAADECTIEATAKTGASKDYTITKSIENGGKVAPDGTVTTKFTITGKGGLIYEIRDFHPAEFVMEKAELKKAVGGWENVTTKAGQRDGAVRMGTTTGWSTANATITLRVTYRAPGNVVPGRKLPMPGADANIAVSGGNRDFRDMGLCLSGRLPNSVEGLGSVLRMLGLGSVADIGDGVTGSVSDPSSPLNRLSDSLSG